MSFKCPIIPLHIQYNYIYTWRNSPYFSFPSLAPLCSPFVSPSTYLAPSSCDRNRPPQSQVACKLTPFAPPLTWPTPPLQIPRTPTAQRLTKTTSGTITVAQLRDWPAFGERPSRSTWLTVHFVHSSMVVQVNSTSPAVNSSSTILNSCFLCPQLFQSPDLYSLWTFPPHIFLKASRFCLLKSIIEDATENLKTIQGSFLSCVLTTKPIRFSGDIPFTVSDYLIS
jgi:hypothetical protein